LRLENEHLRAALKRIVDLRHLSSTREMAEIAAFALRDLGAHRVFSGELTEAAVHAWRDAVNGSSTEARSLVDGSSEGSDREEEGRTRGQDHR
jgi:hypothetical protein